jgi:DNA-binding beta-propeller fold protein YncE
VAHGHDPVSSRAARGKWPIDHAAVTVLVLLVMVLLAWPAIALVLEWWAPSAASTAAGGGIDAPLPLLARSLAWSIGASLVGAALAWPASRVFRRDGDGLLRRSAASLVLLPLALPPWLLYAAMWMSTGPGTTLGDLCARHDLVTLQRSVFLGVALCVWSTALAFAVLVATGGAAEARGSQLRALDGAGAFARLRAAVARDARALVLAVLGATVFLLCETTVFDLAQVKTYGFELRTLDALGGSVREVLAAAAPAIAIVALLVAALPFVARAAGDDRLRLRPGTAPVATRVSAGARTDRGVCATGAPRGHTGPRTSTRARLALGVAAMPAAVLLGAMLAVAIDTPRASDFLALHGHAVGASSLVALLSALLVGAIAASVRAIVDPVRGEGGYARSVRLVGGAAAMCLLVAGVVPGTVTALAVEAAYNRPEPGFLASAILAPIYDSPLAVVLVLAMRAAPVAALVALLLAVREPRTNARLRALDGGSWWARWRGLRAELGMAAGAATAIALAWNLGELTASGRVVPPGLPWLATDVLNAIHYQRPETVVLAVLAIVVVALPAVWIVLRLLERLQRGHASPRARRVAVMVTPPAGFVSGLLGASMLAVSVFGASMLPLVGCERAPAAGSGDSVADDGVMSLLRQSAPIVAMALPVDRAFAGVGRGRGQFNAPRVLALDPLDGSCFVIDKDARVQRIAADGTVRAEWSMPKSDRGKPVGASIAPDGSLVVADTHEHRLVCFAPDGTLLWTHGSYGTEHGQFIYPTDVLFLADGRMMVAEYGGHDRIQVFGRDRSFLYAFGSGGTADGEFLRPQALAYDEERDELFVADAGNHRIQVFTADGEFRRSLGAAGASAGQFRYPFGVVLLIDGRAVEPLRNGVVGPAPAPDGRRTLVVLEHSNHRLQEIDAVSGESLGVAGGLGREAGRLKYPWAIASAAPGVDGAQRFAVCEQGNSRIVFFSLPRWPRDSD